MFKATSSLLQGDALLIKSSIAQATKTPEEAPSIVVESSRGHNETLVAPIKDGLLRSKVTLKVKDKPLEKDLKSQNNDDMKNEGRGDRDKGDRDDVLDKDNDDKTPTNEMSISSINDMTDNSILKESMESEKQVMLLADDLKTDLIMADEEKDDDNSERNKFVNAWVSRLACEEKGNTPDRF